MGENKTLNLQDIIAEIEHEKILLPDFQRQFVWSEEERQKKIVASVLTKMPIGSILFLEAPASDYSSKVIGCQKVINLNNPDDKVKFLLDGQQRITVLTNVFSNVIHNHCDKVTDLVSPSLKRRFFLMVPKWSNKEAHDLFGVQNLEFPYKDPDSSDPDFLSGDIMPFIVCVTFLVKDNAPYSPNVDLSTKLDDFCLNYEGGYLIPLFLMTPSCEKKPDQVRLRLQTIRKNIAEKIAQEIEANFTALTDQNEKQSFIDKLFKNDKIAHDEISSDFSLLNEKLLERAFVWQESLKEYLDSCVKKIALNDILVSAEKRARAIDIYESLNIGGVCLNLFDLIMAKVAKVSKKPYYERLISSISDEKGYDVNLIPQNVALTMQQRKLKDSEGNECNLLKNKIYNASVFTKCYNEEKNEINSKYIDAFLNTLSLYTYNKNYKADEYKVEQIKRGKILELTPEDIDTNTEKICCALDRALFFFQTRCGIRSINELNYTLMISLVATIFTNNNWFNDVNTHRKLEAWYWSSIFSGNYDRDQSTRFIQDLQSIISILKSEKGNEYIENNINYIFEAQNFSDKKLLLMEKVDEERYPKQVLRNFVCQYLLAKTYPDMFDAKETISVFYDKADTLEAHHIIPLGSVKKVGESTKKLRRDNKNICNSPLNFVLITKKSNDEISDDTLDIYIKKITDEAKTALLIQNYINPEIGAGDIKNILQQRYNMLKGDIKLHVRNLLK